MVFSSFDEKFVKKVVQMYYSPSRKSIYTEELRETLIFIQTVNH